MRIHLLGQPRSQTTRAYSLDGFAQNIMRFARVLKESGHTVFLYAGEENESPCDELITVVSEEERKSFLGKIPYQDAVDESLWPLWDLANRRMIDGIRARRQEKDIICTVGGLSHRAVLDYFPELLGVEYNIGYEGSFAKYRVFQSYAWMHYTYGKQGLGNGHFYHTVIPAFYDPADFEPRQPEDYFLYVGRLTPSKGVTIATAAAKRAGVKLKIVGHGDKELADGHEYLGILDMTERNKVIAGAKAVFCPTLYVEPFNVVAIEAQLSGVPVISTDFGGMSETVEQGKTGFRCSILHDFVRAIQDIGSIDRSYVRARAVERFSLDAVKPQYNAYFERLMSLWDGGWYFDPHSNADKTRLWYPDRIEVTDRDRKSAETGLGMWDAWQEKVKAALPNFAAPGIFVSQDRPAIDYIRVANYVYKRKPVDLPGKMRDTEFGALAFETPSLGTVTRAWLDSNVEIDFLRRHLGDKLSKMSALDIGAGYGRLAVSMRPFVQEFYCVDGVDISTQICRQYTQRFAPSVKVLTKKDLPGMTIDLAMNIHSWNECSYVQIKEWIDAIVSMRAQYIFFVSHSYYPDKAYESWSSDGKSFRPLLEERFSLVVQETIGISDHVHTLWRSRTA